MQKQYLTLVIVLSALSFPASGMEKKVTKQERQIIDWTREVSDQHRANFYDVLQKEALWEKMDKTTTKDEKKSFFNMCTIL